MDIPSCSTGRYDVELSRRFTQDERQMSSLDHWSWSGAPAAGRLVADLDLAVLGLDHALDDD